MNRRERNLLILLGLVFAVSLPFLPFWGGDEERAGVAGDDYPAGKQGRNAGGTGPSAASFPRLDKELLSSQPERFEGALRNLFTFSAVREANVFDNDTNIETGSTEASGNPESAEVDEASATGRPARQRLTDYEYLGFIEREETKHVAFLWRGRYFSGQIGDTVNKTFEIKAIEKNFILIYVIGGDFEQRLTLKPPAGDQDEGEDT
ncbi:MAG TPA: hypothetical protein VMX35_05610 [Acidobacteriota bacterium]|nr:hypothetical protein [Acidobacteriota bacterium]